MKNLIVEPYIFARKDQLKKAREAGHLVACFGKPEYGDMIALYSQSSIDALREKINSFPQWQPIETAPKPLKVMKVEIELACKGANFGSANHERLIRDALLKHAIGYHNGNTVQSILVHLGFITDNLMLTKKGREYVSDSFLSPFGDMHKPIQRESK